MAEYFSRDTVIAISTRPETTYNTASTTLGDYTSVAVDLVYPIPEMEKRDTAGLAGLEWTNVQCNHYWSPATVNLAFRLWDNGISQRLGSRAFNGTITGTNPAVGAYKYSTALQTRSQGVNLKGTSLAIKNQNHSFLFAGMAVSRFEIAQEGGNDPVVSATLVGSGKFTNPCPFTPAQPTPACPQTLTTFINVTDADGSRDLYSASVYSWRVFIDNNADASSALIRKANDSSTGPTNGQAKYVSKVVRQFPRNMGAEVLVNADAYTGAAGYWEQMAENEAISTVQFKVRGSLITGSTYNEVLWEFPSGWWRSVGVEDFNGVLANRLVFVPKDDGSTGTNGAKFEVTNTTASNYD